MANTFHIWERRRPWFGLPEDSCDLLQALQKANGGIPLSDHKGKVGASLSLLPTLTPKQSHSRKDFPFSSFIVVGPGTVSACPLCVSILDGILCCGASFPRLEKDSLWVVRRPQKFPA